MTNGSKSLFAHGMRAVPADLAKAVVDEAVKHRKADREDDVTAVAIRITENGH